jgi:heptosyltransferase-1
MSSQMSSNDNPKVSNLRRILVVRLGAMGDVIHALPAVSALAQALPTACIDWIVEPRWACLLQDNSHVNSVIPFPLKAWRKQPLNSNSWAACRSLISDLRSQNYDLVIDLQGLIKSAVLARLTGSSRLAGFERSALREPLAANFYTERLPSSGQHVVDKNLAAIASLLETPRFGAEFPLPKGEDLANLPDDFILTTPVAGWGWKQWPSTRYAQLAGLVQQRLGLPLVLDCAPNDHSYVEEIARTAPYGSTHIHVSTIPELIGATRRARAVVGVDSGPLHIAAALQKPGVGIFGPTDPARNGPYGGTLTVLCDETAPTTNQRGAASSVAMRAITAEQVCDELTRLLAQTPE